MKTTKSLKTVAFALGLAAMLAPLPMNAQYRENQFGLQEWGQTSLLGKESPSSSSGFNISVEQFGGENGGGQGGFNIGTEQFGAPLGSGLFIMAAAGAAYAFSKKRKKQENN
jgi:hypothetical protein